MRLPGRTSSGWVTAFLAAWMAWLPVVSHAAELNWNRQGQVGTGPTPAEASGEGGLSRLDASRFYVNNNIGAAMLRLPADEVQNEKFVRQMERGVVFAQYDPANLSGTISVARSRQLPNNDVVLEVARVTPEDGRIFRANFLGVNPFWQFKGGDNGSFIRAKPAAFMTAVGLVMQHVQTNLGWVAMSEYKWEKENGDLTNQPTTYTECSSGTFTKTCTTKEKVHMKPRWVAAVPSGTVSGGFQGYTVPLCQPTSFQEPVMGMNGPIPNASGESCDGGNGYYLTPQQATTLQTSMTEGDVGTATEPVTQTVNGEEVAAMKVASGVSFVQQGKHHNLPDGTHMIFKQKESESGFTGLAMTLAIAAIAAGGVYAGVMLANAGFTIATVPASMVPSMGTQIAIGAAGGAGANYLGRQMAYGDPGMGDIQWTGGDAGSFFEDGVQGDRWDLAPSGESPGDNEVAQIGENVNLDYGFVDAQQTMDQLYETDFPGGYSEERYRPWSRKDKWDPRADGYREITGGAGGSFAQGKQGARKRLQRANLPTSLAENVREGLDLSTLGSSSSLDTIDFQ